MKSGGNITKTYAFGILAVLLLVFGSITGYAVWSDSKTVFHSADDVKVNIEGTDYSLQDAVNEGKIGSSADSKTVYSFRVVRDGNNFVKQNLPSGWNVSLNNGAGTVTHGLGTAGYTVFLTSSISGNLYAGTPGANSFGYTYPGTVGGTENILIVMD